MRRVSVVGTSGAGKSTLGAALAARLGVDFLELDSVFHQPGWVPLPREEFRERVAVAVAGERWVIDGNYSMVRDLVWARADTVVWLDLPKRTVMRQVIWRSFRRAAARVELWNGNRERWRNFFALDKGGVRHLLGVADARDDPRQVRGGDGRSGEQSPGVRSAHYPGGGAAVPAFRGTVAGLRR